MACVHADTANLLPPGPSRAVYREDCTQCFDSIDSPDGLDVCLHCFNGGCTGDRNHASFHRVLQQHPLVLNIKRTKRVVVRDEPPRKITKVAVIAETEEDRYEYRTTVHCRECSVDVETPSDKVAAVVEGIMKANTFSRQAEVQAWEQEMTSCEHIRLLRQEDAKPVTQDLGHCSSCDLKENLWLCLECGNLGCGRSQFGGVSGNSHGLEHTKVSGHKVGVKLGSITSEGAADIYCYACDEERIDEDLGTHLAHWGILLAGREKTEKTLKEMELDQNLRWDFSMVDESGQELEKLFGEGFTGMKNIGNSCYLASCLQCLFALPQFQARYDTPSIDLPVVLDPAQDLETQIRKIADGLQSGRYSHPDPDVPVESGDGLAYQRGIAPAMFKHLVGKGHEEFSTMRQQDAFEFLLHLFKLISRSPHPEDLEDPVKSFQFVLEQRLQCLGCQRVRYKSDQQDNLSIAVPIRKVALPDKSEDVNMEESKNAPEDEYEPVTLRECMDIFTAKDVVELACSACDSKSFTKQSLFKTFPDVLAINARRFVMVNWVPTKINVPVLISEAIGDEALNMNNYLSPGLQSTEEVLPDDAAQSASSFTGNPQAMAELTGMGFPENRCEKALHATGNTETAAAMEWLFSHMDDADIDDPLVVVAGAAASSDADQEKMQSLENMGIPTANARRALRETSGNVERAVDWYFNHMEEEGDSDDAPAAGGSAQKELPGSATLPADFKLKSIICHKGRSVHAGHYVAFVRTMLPEQGHEGWVLFNDEKVVKAVDIEDMKKSAYVYFFERT